MVGQGAQFRGGANRAGELAMTVQERIETKLREGLQLAHLEVVNESSQHNVAPGSESHFKVVAVAAQFDGRNLVQRHRIVYGLLSEEMRGQVHALALHTYSEQDWASANAQTMDSPECLGGKALEKA